MRENIDRSSEPGGGEKIYWVLVFAKGGDKSWSVGLLGYCFFTKTTNLKIKNKKFWKIKKKFYGKKKIL